MRYIAAPWRGDYVRNVHKKAASGCVFCRAASLADDRKARVLHRGEAAFVIMNTYPYQSGHVMIAPVRHTADFERAPKALTDEMSDLLKLALAVLRKAYRPQGFNVGMNLGRSAGAGVADHFHIHIVPRWQGDSNFMPVVGRTKVVLEDLDTTYDRLRPLFEEAAARRRAPSAKTHLR
jgi:ATP adenylyltransferase